MIVNTEIGGFMQEPYSEDSSNGLSTKLRTKEELENTFYNCGKIIPFPLIPKLETNINNEQTFRQFSEKYVQLKELSGKEHKTILFYKNLLSRINPIIGDYLLSSITSIDIEDVYIKIGETGQNKVTGNKLSSKTILKHLRLISSIFDAAIKKGLVSTNPAKGIDKHKVIHKKANFFQPSELHQIHDALANEPLKWKLITLLLMYTGCRRSEILGLSWENINFTESVININRTILYSAEKGIYESTTKTPESNRSLKLPAEAMELLKKQRSGKTGKKYAKEVIGRIPIMYLHRKMGIPYIQIA